MKHSQGQKNSLPSSNPPYLLGSFALQHQSLPLLLCLSYHLFAVSPFEAIKEIDIFIAYFSQCKLLFVIIEI